MNDSQKEQRSDSVFSLKAILALMTISVPMLYMLGFLYHMGRLSAFGLSVDYFPLSIQQYMTESFIYFLGFGLEGLEAFQRNAVLIPIAALILYVIGVGIVHYVSNEEGYKESASKVAKTGLFKYGIIPAYFSAAVLYVLSVFISILIIILVFPVDAFVYGEESGKELIAKYEGCEEGKPRESYICTFIYKNGELIQSGVFIERSDSVIAIWDGDKANVIENAGLVIQTINSTASK